MSHEITSRDAVFAVREPAWHGLATVLTDYPAREEAQKLVHPWEPVAEDVFRRLELEPLREKITSTLFEPVSTEAILDQVMAEIAAAQDKRLIPGSKLNARSDDGYPLGVVSSTFETVTNTEMWDIGEAIQTGDSRGDVMFETGGSLKGGAKVWLLIRLKEPIAVTGDPRGATIPYYALQNAHDGSGSFRGQATFSRIVCDNTAQAADLDAQARGTEFVFSHTKNIRERIEEARAALSGWRASIDAWQQFSEHMAAFRVTEDEAERFLAKFIPEPPGEVVSDIVRENVAKARGEWRGHWNSITNEGVKLTSLGLVNASIEYSQHSRRALSKESAFKRAYLDRSRLTSKAVELARAVAGA